MKRSEVNRYIKDSIALLKEMNFNLPIWAYWNIAKWKKNQNKCQEIFNNLLGWDITDFGKNKFNDFGLILFTIRNGNLLKDKKPYAEKIMIASPGQKTPMHFHKIKVEDIINRGGGNLVMEVFHSTDREDLSKEPVLIKIDGIEHKVKAGENIILKPGDSIFLENYVYHSFHADKETVLIGEVSSINDDITDNRFYKPLARFPDITEDEKPEYLLVNDYKKFLN